LSVKDTLLHFVVPVTFWAHDHESPPSVVNEVAAAAGDDDPLVGVAPDVHDAAATSVTASAAVQRRALGNIDLISLSTGKPKCLG
jgi:hypothetical protein